VENGLTSIDANEPLRDNRMATRLKDALRPFASTLPSLSGLPSWARTLRVLQRRGFAPATIFDIGVGYGTFPLYRAFPGAFYHLVDPARESLAYMRRLSRQLRCEIHTVALGDRDGEVALEVRADIQESTLLEEVGPREVRRIDRVAMRRFDSLFGPIERPSLCKIDVQGAELMVLGGMSGRLAEIDALVIETSTIATVKGGAEVYDVVRFLGEHGFALADIVGLRRRPLDDATAQLDLMFVPHDGGPRIDRRWAAST
jgi:FkbM family methyltransferase